MAKGNVVLIDILVAFSQELFHSVNVQGNVQVSAVINKGLVSTQLKSVNLFILYWMRRLCFTECLSLFQINTTVMNSFF